MKQYKNTVNTSTQITKTHTHLILQNKLKQLNFSMCLRYKFKMALDVGR